MLKQIVALAIFLYALLNFNLPWNVRLILLIISYDAINFFLKFLSAVTVYYLQLTELYPVLGLLLALELFTFAFSFGVFKPVVKALIVFLVAGLTFPLEIALFAAVGSLLLNSVLK